MAVDNVDCVPDGDTVVVMLVGDDGGGCGVRAGDIDLVERGLDMSENQRVRPHSKQYVAVDVVVVVVVVMLLLG